MSGLTPENPINGFQFFRIKSGCYIIVTGDFEALDETIRRIITSFLSSIKKMISLHLGLSLTDQKWCIYRNLIFQLAGI